MGLWPGDDYFGYRYESQPSTSRAARAVGEGPLRPGRQYHDERLRAVATPAGKVDIVSRPVRAGHAVLRRVRHYNFILTPGSMDPRRIGTHPAPGRGGKDWPGRRLTALFMAIMAGYDEEAQAKWGHTTPARTRQRWAICPTRAPGRRGGRLRHVRARSNLPEGAINFNMATLVGSYERSRQVDQSPPCPG